MIGQLIIGWAVKELISPTSSQESSSSSNNQSNDNYYKKKANELERQNKGLKEHIDGLNDIIDQID